MFYLRNEQIESDIAKLDEFADELIKSDDTLVDLFGRIQLDSALREHSRNVAKIAATIGMAYNFNLDELFNMYIGAIFHDVGKLKLNNKILYKKGIFTSDERLYAETHSTIGYKLVKDTILSPTSIAIVRSHHEKLDGSGYPSFLDRKEISIYTQIVTVADMFEAMIANRCYRPALAEEEVYDILTQDKGLNQIAVKVLKECVAVNECEVFFFLQNRQEA